MCATDESMTIEQWQGELAGAFEPLKHLLIPMLQHIQHKAGYLPQEAMGATAKFLRVSAAKVYGVASFYAQFHFEPRGRNTVTVCRGTACHVRGSARLLKDVESHLGIEAGSTTEDLQFSVETVACYGSCALAPVVVINDRVLGGQSAATIKGSIDQLKTPIASEETPS